ncbi:MAG: class I SAM-dependent methyltransferase [Cyanobacteriota bacterium]
MKRSAFAPGSIPSVRFVNLGCGPVFVAEPEWINFDFVSRSRHVLSADLLQPLPLESRSVDAVYSSHFIEHIPRDNVHTVLNECARVLKPGGILRLVMPDFEEMCAAYLMYRQKGDHEKADFLVIEIIDQSVRRYPGGELGKYYHKLAGDKKSSGDMIDFLGFRNGHLLHSDSFSHDISTLEITQKNVTIKKRIRQSLLATRSLLEDFLFQVGIRLLPRPFVRQNVSFASLGELHHWLWDFHQLKHELIAAGFQDVVRMNPSESNIPNFPYHPLDIYPDGRPRKGAESMYVEAFMP